MVELNVGGRVFHSSCATLTKSPMLALLLSEGSQGRFSVERDPSERIFLDRDPELFARVLYFLRHGRVRTDEMYDRTPELLQEFDYFQVDFDPSRLDTSHAYYSRLTWNAVQDFIAEFMVQVRPMLERAARRGIPRLRVRLFRTMEGKNKECIMWQQPQMPCCSIHNDIWFFSALERPDLWRDQIKFCEILPKVAGRGSRNPLDHVEFNFSWPLQHPFRAAWDGQRRFAGPYGAVCAAAQSAPLQLLQLGALLIALIAVLSRLWAGG